MLKNKKYLAGLIFGGALFLFFGAPQALGQAPSPCQSIPSSACFPPTDANPTCATNFIAITATGCPQGSLCCVPSGGAAGLVPCGNGMNYANRCTLCHLVVGFQVLITYAFRIAVFLALLMLVVGGVMYAVSAGSTEMINSAKSIIKNTLYGFAFILGAWLVINTTMSVLGSQANLGIVQVSEGWWNFRCVQ